MFSINSTLLTTTIKSRQSTSPYIHSSAGGVRLTNCTITDDLVYPNTIPPLAILFKECKFIGRVKFDDFSAITQLSFENCEFDNALELQNCNKPLFITGGKFNSLIISADGVNDLSLADIEIGGTMKLGGKFTGILSFSNINKKTRNGIIVLNGADIYKLEASNVSANEFKICEHTHLETNSTLNKLSASKLEINVVKIGHIIHLKSCILDTLTLDNLTENFSRHLRISDECRIEEAHLLLGMLNRTEVIDSFFNKLTLSGSHEKYALFQNLKITEFRLVNLSNKGIISFRKLIFEEGSKILIDSSDIGKTDFIQCDLSKAELDFENSKIVEIFSSDSRFPNLVGSNGKPNYPQAQLVFGQLHTAFAKQGDTVLALTYQSKEIEAHYNNTQWKKGSFFEKLNLFLNKWSNNFGRWWARGVFFTIAVGILFFYLVVLSSDEFVFSLSFTIDDWLWSAFLRFMNPLRFFETESLFKDNSQTSYLHLSKWSYLWDFLGRIFVAYGFYQTIQAFRRFGRK